MAKYALLGKAIGGKLLEITEKKYLLKEELAELKRILKRYASTNERDCLLIEVAMATGARAQEVLNIEVKDLGSRSVYIRGLKKGNNREIPISKDLIRRLKRHCKGRENERVFPISYQRLDQIWRQYRPVKKKFHSLRHNSALALFKKTKDVRLVKYLLGHKHLSTTEIYLDYIYTQSELRKVMGV